MLHFEDRTTRGRGEIEWQDQLLELP